jgi:uncharacterized protein YyaL (SSP411 family)
MAGINFYLEVSALIQAVYKSKTDPEYLELGWAHGEEADTKFVKINPGFFNMTNENSTLTVPTTYFGKGGNLLAVQM